MKRNEIRTIIRTIISDLTKDYIRQFGIPHQPKELAAAYWDIRDDSEIHRDQVNDVILLDYEFFVMAVVADHQTENILLKFKTYRK